MLTWLLGFECVSECNFENIFEELRGKISASTRCNVVYHDNSTALFKSESSKVFANMDSENSFLSLDVHCSEPAKVDGDFQVEKLESDIESCSWVKCANNGAYKSLPPFKRGGVRRYDVAAGGKLITEYDFEKVVFDGRSEYQSVRIMESKQFGNILFLDDDLNLAESDLSYTEAITGNGEEDYKGKEVLVLGGGDGGILRHLKDSGAKMITMIDIDGLVVEQAKEHLRGICGDSMDATKGDNFEIIVDDCVKWLKRYAEEGKKFDFVINDLTAIPVSTSPVGDHWDFLRVILQLSFDVLADDGKYFTQGNALLCEDQLKMYEEQLAVLSHSVSFKKENVFVPSYLEMWVFYTVWKNL